MSARSASAARAICASTAAAARSSGSGGALEDGIGDSGEDLIGSWPSPSSDAISHSPVGPTSVVGNDQARPLYTFGGRAATTPITSSLIAWAGDLASLRRVTA